MECRIERYLGKRLLLLKTVDNKILTSSLWNIEFSPQGPESLKEYERVFRDVLKPVRTHLGFD